MLFTNKTLYEEQRWWSVEELVGTWKQKHGSGGQREVCVFFSETCGKI